VYLLRPVEITLRAQSLSGLATLNSLLKKLISSPPFQFFARLFGRALRKIRTDYEIGKSFFGKKITLVNFLFQMLFDLFRVLP